MTPAPLGHALGTMNAVFSLIVLAAAIHQNTHREGDSPSKHWYRCGSTAVVLFGTVANALGAAYGVYWRFAPLSEFCWKAGIAMLAISYLDDQGVLDSLKKAHKVRVWRVANESRSRVAKKTGSR